MNNSLCVIPLTDQLRKFLHTFNFWYLLIITTQTFNHGVVIFKLVGAKQKQQMQRENLLGFSRVAILVVQKTKFIKNIF
jgi:hypothetical protein